MKKLRIELDTEKCIDNRSCINIDPLHFKSKDNKAFLKKGAGKGNLQVLNLEVSDQEAEKIIKAASSCPTNSIKVIDVQDQKELVTTELKQDNIKEIEAKYDDNKEFVLDPAGYFLIRINKEKKLIEVGFCNERNKLVLKIVGKKPIEVYNEIVNKEKLPIRKDHCAYLGRELQKAYISLQENLEYIQDEELKFQ
ncbi:ferredoxin [Candidatus Woesearchaeota archaeon]|nr:ferredoxin [Candidatus Woesearchaeota archaeon]